jgi:hypothetical protein
MDPALPPCYGEPLRNFENVLVILRDMESDHVVGLRILNARANGLEKVRFSVDREKKAIERVQVTGQQVVGDEAEKTFLDELDTIDRLLSSEVFEEARRKLGGSSEEARRKLAST